MTTDVDQRGPRKRQTWKGILGWTLTILVVLIVATYFVVTSSSFVKGVILPRVGQLLNSDLKVETVSLHPFSEVQMTGLKLQPKGKDTLLTASEARVRYGLIDIIRGTMRVDQLTLVSPVVELVKSPDGSSNLDPLTQGSSKENPAPSESKKYQLAIKNVSVKNATLRMIDKLKDGGSKTSELSHLNLTLDQLITGSPGKLTLSSDLSMLNNPKGGTNDLLSGSLTGAFEVTLDDALKPQELKGTAALKVAQTAGAYADFTGLAATLDADITPTETRQATVHFSKKDQSLGELRVSGPFNMNTMEGRLTQTFSMDQQILNMVGASRNLDFRKSNFNSTNVIDLSKRGNLISVAGKLSGRGISIAKESQQTPVLNLNADYQITIDLGEASALIQKLDLTGTQNGADLLEASLSRPMNLSWGNGIPGFTDSAFHLVLTNLNLVQWAGVMGTNSPTGSVSARLDLLAQQDGRALSTTISASINDLAMKFGTNVLRSTDVQVSASGKVENMRVINLANYSLSVQQNKGMLLQGEGSLRYDLKNQDLRGEATLEANLATALQQFPVPQFSASTGAVKAAANFSMEAGKTTANGNLSLEDFSGKYARYVFDKFPAALQYNIELSNGLLQIQRGALSFGQDGSLELKGNYDLAKKTANLEFKVIELNQNALAPFLAPALGENKLVPISLNSGGTIGYDPNGETSVKADVNMEKWVVQDIAKKMPNQPLSAQLQLDAGMSKQIVDLRQILLKLSPTDRAKNELSVKGRMDLAKTNAAPGTLSIQSDSLDLTPYYNLFAGADHSGAPSNNKKASTETAVANPEIPANDPNKEPAAVTLPFQHFTANLNVGQLYLRQVAISNLTATVGITNAEVRVKPLQLTLNGAPVAANILLNLGVPGYTYDLSFDADHVPMEPLVNSFSTNSSGQLKGLLVANAKINGAGITGRNLQKNLNGSASFSLTNMNVQVISPKWRNVLEPIALVLNLPELTDTPLDWLTAQTEIGAGKINLRQFTVESAAFLAHTQGSIPIEPIPTNSPLNLPLSISISRGLAQKARVPITDSGGDTNYVKLPDFVTINGTLGKPGTKINKLAIAGMIAQSSGLTDKALKALPPGAGGLLQNILGGGSAAGKSASTNGTPATNSAGANLLRGLSGILKAQPTNPPPANTNGTAKPPARSNPLDLLRNFGK